MRFEPGGVLADWTGCTAPLAVRSNFGSSTKLHEVTTENDGIERDRADTLTLALSSDDTGALTFKRAVCHLGIVPRAAERYRLLESSVFLSREVTR